MPTSETNAAAAGTWTLGDLTVHRLGFGAMRLTGSAAFDLGTPSDRCRSIAVLRRALDLGVNHVDTAGFYFSPTRSANELINTALNPYAKDLVIATKVGPTRDPAGAWLGLARPEDLRGQVEENLRQLGRDHLDVVNLRTHGVDDISGHFGALADLRRAGLIRHLGLSNVRAAHIDQARAIAPVVCVQNRYGHDKRNGDEVLRFCGERGIAFVPFFALAGDRREEGGVTPDDRIEAVAAARGVTAAQVRVAWTLSRGPHVLAIPGTGDPDHLAENVAAAALVLTAEELAHLE